MVLGSSRGNAVANADGCPVLQTETADTTTSASEAKVHSAEDCKLCADANTRHNDGEWLLPLAGKATGQPLPYQKWESYIRNEPNDQLNFAVNLKIIESLTYSS